MEIRKIALSIIVAASVLFASIPAYAANGSTQTANTDGSLNCAVSAVVSSTYSVSLPATLTLSYNDSTHKYENTYTVGAKGNIRANQYVSIVPDNSFIMTGSVVGATATATVTQSVTQWSGTTPTVGQLAIGTTGYTETTGSVEVELTQADNYSGSFTFTYSLSTI